MYIELRGEPRSIYIYFFKFIEYYNNILIIFIYRTIKRLQFDNTIS